jgi:hypothetical protein
MTEPRTQTDGQPPPGPVSSADAAFDRLMLQVQELQARTSPSPRRTAQLLEDALSGWAGTPSGSSQAGSTQADSTQAGSTQGDSTQAGSTQGGSTQGGSTRMGATHPRAAAARSLDLVTELMNDALGLLAEFVDSNLPEESSRAAAPMESVTVSGRPGDRAGTSIWVHHQESSSGRPVPLRLTDLFGHDGSRLSGSAGTFAVVARPESASGSSESWLEIQIPSDLPCGVYHGHVLAVDLPDSAINLRLLVQP